MGRKGVSLTVTLAVSISVLVLIAVASVLGLGLVSGLRNTTALLRDKAKVAVDHMVGKVESHLGAARDQLDYVAKLIDSGALDLSDKQRLHDVMVGSLAAAPQLSAILFMTPDYQTTIVARTPAGPRIYERRDDSADKDMQAAMLSVRDANGVVWGEPVWRELPRETMLNLRKAVRREGKFAGTLIAAVSIRELSSYLGRFKVDAGNNAFILRDRTKLIAHPNLVTQASRRTKDEPLPDLRNIGDPVLAAIWQEKDRYPLRILRGTRLKGHVLRIFNEEYIYIYQDIPGFGEKTWQIGTYLRSRDVNSELRRLQRALIAGLVMLLVSILFAIFMARRIARPIVRLAQSASRIGQLEISQTKEVPGSIFRELDDQARAFNAMLQGLKWFEAYVPKKLVRRLIQQGNNEMPQSEVRDVTVMFTDIEGFTTLSEGAPADQVAGFLNRHFALLAACIEEEDGTVDKFIGDSVMAFWGAPDVQPDHAERAVRAARKIMAAVAEENRARLASGEEAPRIRVGLHSGPVTVGNIGSPDRINYTIIGDTVNVGNRIEQAGKLIDTGANDGRSVVTLASAQVLERLGPKENLVSLGPQKLRGRDEAIEVFRID